MAIFGLIPTDAEQDYKQRIEGLVNGTGPSLARQQLQQGQQRAFAQAYALAHENRGNPALGVRNAQLANANTQAATNAAAAQVRAQEQLGALGAQNQLNQYNSQQTNAGLSGLIGMGGNIASLAGAASGGPVGGMAAGAGADLIGKGVGELMGGKGEENKASAFKASQPASGGQQTKSPFGPGALSGGVGGATGALGAAPAPTAQMPITSSWTPAPQAQQQSPWQWQQGGTYHQGAAPHVGGFGPTSDRDFGRTFSDERIKRDVHPADGAIQKMLNDMSPEAYRYRSDTPEARSGQVNPNQQNYGVMAQQLAQSQAGRQMITENDRGTMQINNKQAIPALLAAVAFLNQRLNQQSGVEKAGKSQGSPPSYGEWGKGSNLASDEQAGSNLAGKQGPSERGMRSALGGMGAEGPSDVAAAGRAPVAQPARAAALEHGRRRGGGHRRHVAPPSMPVPNAEMSYDPSQYAGMSQDPAAWASEQPGNFSGGYAPPPQSMGPPPAQHFFNPHVGPAYPPPAPPDPRRGTRFSEGYSSPQSRAGLRGR